MGIYDREYYQDDTPQGFRLGGGARMMVTNLVIVTAVVALIDMFTPASEDGTSHWLADLLSLKADFYRRPWEVWNLLSYGFAHAPLETRDGFWHVAMNMFVLWMFGRAVEMRIGRLEFLWYYLVAIVWSGLVYVGLENIVQPGGHVSVVGASGGVTAVFILFVIYFPRQTVFFLGLIAMPAWVIGALVIGLDLLGALTGTAGNVAWQAHLGGAAFAFLYTRFGWRFDRFLSPDGRWRWKWPRPGRRLRIHRPQADSDTLDGEADRILEKVHREGEQSLSSRERRILEQYSRRMREKRR